MFGVVVPVKPPAVAKSRLAGLGDEVRLELCEAFALDTVNAVTECALVGAVLVVTDDVPLARALADLGIPVIPDGVTDDLNASLEQGAAELSRRYPDLGVAAVFADLPSLRPAELELALRAASPDGLSFVADAGRAGTTTVIAPSVEVFRPRFGPGSRQAHLDAGAVEILDELPGLRRDVDTPDDLAAAVALGTGPRTSYVVTLHGLLGVGR